ncbi:unnamed protein product [Adineta ricciae]|uniref:receptor protein-tyrosine kinase n=1 Tax=Adineta ricciae TaxID=249248 RepID=A0A813U1K3_ADIRI|nr:unnamed protein product [Adineta ricciae]CAF0821425.1 unnamed protein product [Adineta ricciae]
MNECGAVQKSSSVRVKRIEQSTIQIMTRYFLVFATFILFELVHSEEQLVQTDSRLSSSSLCSIHRQGFSQFERVQLTSTSINIRLKNIFSEVTCPSVRVDVAITNLQTNKLERTIENIQTSTVRIDQLFPNENYSITVKISNEIDTRILPAHVFQTLPFASQQTETLTNEDLLSIEHIEAFVLPHTLLYIVTLPPQMRRASILANITLSYFHNRRQYQYHQLVKPLDNNVISHLGRLTTKTIAFSLELPYENKTSIEYTSFIQLFLSNDQRHSIVDHPVIIESPQPITMEFISLSTRSMRVSIHHLCLSYIEVKVTVYQNSEIISRGQCDINKKDNSLEAIVNGQCSLMFDKLQPEQNYSLSIRTTCPITTSSGASYVFYDRARVFPFQTTSGLPDDRSFLLSFSQTNRTISWKEPSSNMSYFGPDYYYQLLIKLNQNWTLIYQGNETFYQLNKTLIDRTNLTFRLYVGNRFGRQEKNYSQIDIHINAVRPSYTNNQIVSFTLLILFLLLLLFGFLCFGFYLRNKKLYGKLKKKYYQNGEISDKELEHLRSLTHPTGLKDNILYTWNHTPTNGDLNKLPTIERALIKLDRLIGKGAFGEVYAGTMLSKQPVAVKTLLSTASSSQRVDFLKEAIIMNQFSHEHIIHLLGVCFQNDNQPQFLVLELMNRGDLQNYLRRSRPTKENNYQCQLSYEDCLDIAKQIADGACYLEQHSYVHRDLAARNCLVSTSENGNMVVKIGDFGLARMLSQQDYYRKTGEALLPVRWMAPESLLDALFTSHSDIWSFGIVMWEIITLGQVPYSPLNNQQVISLVTTTRGTLQKPTQCTQTLYELMITCWHYIPENRLNFRDVHSRLNEIELDKQKEQPATWFSYETSSETARQVVNGVLSHIEPPTSISFEGSDAGECRSSTSGCFSSMTESNSQLHHHSNRLASPYQLRLIDDTTSNEFMGDSHSDIIVRSL